MYAGLSSSFVSKLLGGGRSPPPVQHDESKLAAWGELHRFLIGTH